MKPMTKESLQEVLDNKSMPIPESGCRIWMGSLLNGGYGTLTYRTKRYMAHRASYELNKGPIPEGLEIDHLCRVRSCINPNHLEAVTKSVNIRRGNYINGLNKAREIQKAKTHCPHGHPWDEKNTYCNSKGHRFCRKCDSIKHKKARDNEQVHC